MADILKPIQLKSPEKADWSKAADALIQKEMVKEKEKKGPNLAQKNIMSLLTSKVNEKWSFANEAVLHEKRLKFYQNMTTNNQANKIRAEKLEKTLKAHHDQAV